MLPLFSPPLGSRPNLTMGCFNAVCCVTKTPIVEGEQCRALVLRKPNVDMILSGENGALRYVMQESLHEVANGKYNDYGGLEVEGREDWNRGDDSDLRAWFISSEAWTKGEGLARAKWVDDAMTSTYGMYEVIAANSRGSREMGYSLDSPFLRFKPEGRIIIALYSWCYTNRFNMLDPSFSNHYGGQQLYEKEMREWNRLRAARIKGIEKRFADSP